MVGSPHRNEMIGRSRLGDGNLAWPFWALANLASIFLVWKKCFVIFIACFVKDLEECKFLLAGDKTTVSKRQRPKYRAKMHQNALHIPHVVKNANKPLG